MGFQPNVTPIFSGLCEHVVLHPATLNGIHVVLQQHKEALYGIHVVLQQHKEVLYQRLHNLFVHY